MVGGAYGGRGFQLSWVGGRGRLRAGGEPRFTGAEWGRKLVWLSSEMLGAGPWGCSQGVEWGVGLVAAEPR